MAISTAWGSMATGTAELGVIEAFALIGAAGVGAQWLAWRLRLPAIVLMLAAGLLLGPVTGILIPARDIGALVGPMVSLAVSVILFEGGLTLNFRKLADARPAVHRLVWVGAPVGWALNTLALMLIGGLSWQSSLVFGGIMIVTGPTVIAPLLRPAKIQSRPAQLLQVGGVVGCLGRHGLVGAEGGQNTRFKTLRRNSLVMFQCVGRVVGGAYHLHIHLG